MDPSSALRIDFHAVLTLFHKEPRQQDDAKYRLVTEKFQLHFQITGYSGETVDAHQIVRL